MKTPDIHHSILPRWGRSAKWCFIYVGLVPPTLDFFFADFYWDMSGQWINIYNVCYIVVLEKKSVKLLKTALLGPYLGKNWASMGYAQN